MSELMSADAMKTITQQAKKEQDNKFLKVSEERFMQCKTEIMKSAQNGQSNCECLFMAEKHMDLLRAAGYHTKMGCYDWVIISWPAKK